MARQVADPYLFDPGTVTAPVRSTTPRLQYQAGPVNGSAMPIWGVLGLAAVVLLFEWMRRRRGGK